MSEPICLLQLPQVAQRLGLFYSTLYRASVAGELQSRFALLNGSALFPADGLKDVLDCLKSRLSARDFEKVQQRLATREERIAAIGRNDGRSAIAAGNDK
jgi:hypothetical protein